MRLTRDRVHAVLLANPGSTIDQLTDQIGATRRAVELHLHRLADAGLAHSVPGEPTGFRGQPPARWHGRQKARTVASVWDLAA